MMWPMNLSISSVNGPGDQFLRRSTISPRSSHRTATGGYKDVSRAMETKHQIASSRRANAFRARWRACTGMISGALLLASCATSPTAPASHIGDLAQNNSDRAMWVTGAPDETSFQSTASSPVSELTQSGLDGGSKEKVQIGTGQFFGAPTATGSDGAVGDGRGLVLNFVDADIREVVRSVLGGSLNLDYVIDPSLTGRVTLQTTRPIPANRILPTLETALGFSGVAIVRSGDLYRVVASDTAASSQVVPSLRPRSDLSGGGYGVQIAPLRHVSVAEMQKILEPLAPKGAILRVDTATNMLLLAGSSDERASMSEIIRIFDVDRLAGMSFALTPLKFSDAGAVVTDLDRVFGENGPFATAGVMQFIPIERMNSVLAISANPAYLARAQEWIKNFDVGNTSLDRRIYIYQVQNGLAVDLAAVLSKIFGGTVDYVSSQASAGPSLSGGLDLSPGAQPSGPAVAQSAAPARDIQPGSAANAVNGKDVRIIANDTNNSLVILSTANQFLQIEDALRRLDVTPLQVLIEATIAEVRLDDNLKYGVKWFFESGDPTLRLSDVNSGAVESNFPGFSALFTGSQSRVVLDALDSVTDINVISSPQIMVLDNHTASMLVGDQVPIATQSSVSVLDPNAPIVNSIEFRDTGVVLNVTPRVNESGLVNLEIEQEVSDVVQTTTSGIDSPTIRQRRIRSSVAIQSGETVALGGLIRDRRTVVSDGVPGVSRVPVLGGLFGTRQNATEKTELLVLITPRVIRNNEQARQITDELRSRIDAFALPKSTSER